MCWWDKSEIINANTLRHLSVLLSRKSRIYRELSSHHQSWRLGHRLTPNTLKWIQIGPAGPDISTLMMMVMSYHGLGISNTNKSHNIMQ